MSRPRHVASERVSRLFRSRAADWITRPWLDRVVLELLENYFFPTSRLWAAARAAQGSVDTFWAELDVEPIAALNHKVSQALDVFEHARLKALATEGLWLDAFFNAAESTRERRLIAEEMRLDYRTRYNMTRRNFLFLKKNLTRSVVIDPPDPETIAARYGRTQAELEKHFKPALRMPQVEQSAALPVPEGEDFWLRFASPDTFMGDEVYARVHSLPGIRNPPTLIFGHGICVEFDHYHNLVDEIAPLRQMGVRVVRPEAPWHGRRVPPGRFGGEQLLSTTPGGMYDFLCAQHQEWSVLIDWARRTSTGPVIIGGSSLGAQTAKAIALHAGSWPKALQPEGLFISTHCHHIAEAALDGALSDIWNLSSALRAHGWSRQLTRERLEMLDSSGEPVMQPEHIVSVLGSADRVTPFSSGSEQMQEWGVPRKNQFEYTRGHFTIPLGMVRQRDPLTRLVEVIRTLR